MALHKARPDVKGVLKACRENGIGVKHLVAKQVHPPIIHKDSLNKMLYRIIISLPIHKVLDQKLECHEQRIREK